MNYSIPWHLLPEDDSDFFDQTEVERGASFIRFNRDLSRKELASLCSRLWNFRSLVADPEENHINFAIGDAFNEFSRRFGKRDGTKFQKMFVRISNLRDHVLRITGGTLVYLQTVEHLIKGCCAMLRLKGLKLTLEDFQSSDASRRRQTLGQLKKALIGTFAFSDEFESRFNRFVGDRNVFVHSLWTDKTKFDERVGLPAERYYKEKLKVTISLLRQANSVELVFRGLLGSIGASLSKNSKNRTVFAQWEKYIVEFRSTLRAPPT